MRRLTDADCREIAKLMRSFRGPITWSDVADLAEEVTGRRYSRQALTKKKDLRNTYNIVRERAPDGTGAGGEAPKSKELALSEARAKRQAAHNEVLEVVVDQVREQFVVWAENARLLGIDDRRLSMPLSPTYLKTSERKRDGKGQKR